MGEVRRVGRVYVRLFMEVFGRRWWKVLSAVGGSRERQFTTEPQGAQRKADALGLIFLQHPASLFSVPPVALW